MKKILHFLVLLVMLTACNSGIEYDSIVVPTSFYQHTNGTWWGNNQIKIVRYEDVVYTYYVNNKNLIDGEPNIDNPSEICLLRINDDMTIEHFDSLYSSRTAALCIDSYGRLLVGNFEPGSAEDNGTSGSIKLYTYNFDNDGSFDRHEETVVPYDPGDELSNIRFGMAIDKDDNLVIGFGMNYYEDEALNHTMTAYIRSSGTEEWEVRRLAETLGEDNYYPLMAINGVEDVRAFSVQDACYPEMTQFEYPCFYQYVRYYDAGEHKKTVDYSHLSIAEEKPQLIEQVGFMIDTSGDTHMISRARIDTGILSYKSTIDYYKGRINNLEKIDTAYLGDMFNWLRIFEYKDTIYLVGATYDSAAIINTETEEIKWLDIPKDAIRGSYIYTNALRGGSDLDKYLDIYFVPADSNQYDHQSLYVRIELENIVNQF